jgi:hypothetical protein
LDTLYGWLLFGKFGCIEIELFLEKNMQMWTGLWKESNDDHGNGLGFMQRIVGWVWYFLLRINIPLLVFYPDAKLLILMIHQ